MTSQSLELPKLEQELFTLVSPGSIQLGPDYEEKLSTRSNFILKGSGALDFGGEGQSGFVFLFQVTPLKDQGVWISMGEIEGSSAPLGIFVKVSGSGLTEEVLYQINQNLRKLMLMKGIMVKGAGKEIWVRIKSDVTEAKHLFETLGALLIARLKREYPEIESVEVVFAVGRSKAYTVLEEISDKNYELTESIKAQVWKDRGYDFKECHVLGHCGQCADKKLCSNVKRIDRLSQAHRVELHQ